MFVFLKTPSCLVLAKLKNNIQIYGIWFTLLTPQTCSGQRLKYDVDHKGINNRVLFACRSYFTVTLNSNGTIYFKTLKLFWAYSFVKKMRRVFVFFKAFF